MPKSKVLYKIPFLAIVVLVIIHGIWWLTLGIGFILLSFLGISVLIKKIKTPAFRNGVSIVLVIVGVLILSSSIRVLGYDLFKVPSGSMRNALYNGDYIMVNKLSYGPKLPGSPFEIPWFNLFFLLKDKARDRINDRWWDYKRLSGKDKISQGDVFVFEKKNKNERIIFYVKRCAAMPGDTVEVVENQLFINKQVPEIMSARLRRDHEVYCHDRKKLISLLDSLKIKTGYFNQHAFEVSLSNDERNTLINYAIVDSIHVRGNDHEIKKRRSPETPFESWTFDSMEPVTVPYSGLQVTLESAHILQLRAIFKYEGANIYYKDGMFWDSGRIVDKYTFKYNYYFMVGDDFDNSRDSRIMGFIPETNIIGKAQLVLFSFKNDYWNWDRFLKPVI